MPHQIYKNKDGKRLVGVTTVCGVLNKPALLQWANKIGLMGIEMNEFVDDKSDIGSLTHDLCTKYLQGIWNGEFIRSYYEESKVIFRIYCKGVDTDAYTLSQIEQAEQAFNSFKAWYESHKVELISAEQPLVSENYQYGGCYDVYAKVDGKLTLLDFKTGSAIYPEHILQVAGGYGLLFQENNMPYDQVRILNIPRTDNENWGELIVNTKQRELAERMFLLCREMYELQRELKNETQIIYPKKHVRSKYEKDKSNMC
jgi:hypothetical protein